MFKIVSKVFKKKKSLKLKFNYCSLFFLLQFVFLSLLAFAFAKPGYIHSAPVISSVRVPIATVVRPVVSSHSVVAAPLIHHQPAILHGSAIHGSYHHGIF